MSGEKISVPPIDKFNAQILKRKGFKIEGEFLILPKPTWSSVVSITTKEDGFMGFPETLTEIKIYNQKNKPYLTIRSFQDADYYGGPSFTYH